MKVYEFGDKKKPVIVLLPGTCCYWKSNFGQVIEGLQKDFYVACVSYDGFDDTEKTVFPSMLEETKKIEDYIIKGYQGSVIAVYGCSLGGSVLGLLLARHRITIGHAIIGGSDFDQYGRIIAKLKTNILLQIMYPLIHDGKLSNAFLQKKLQQRIKELGDYGTTFLRVISCNGKPLRFVSKASVKHQYYSDLITPIPAPLSVSGTRIHILYAEKMGIKYLKRYRRLFPHAHMIRIPLRHEELLMVYPEKWITLIKKLCSISKEQPERCLNRVL